MTVFAIRVDQSFGGGGVVPPSVTVSESRLGPPAAPVAVARTVLVPALSVAGTSTVCHVDQLPVPAKETAVAGPPFTDTSTGRASVLPLAYRNVSVALPAWAAFTENSTKPPAALT